MDQELEPDSGAGHVELHAHRECRDSWQDRGDVPRRWPSGTDHLYTGRTDGARRSCLNPIVEEARTIRAAIAAEHGDDLDAILRALKRKEAADSRRVVDLTTKRASRKRNRRAG